MINCCTSLFAAPSDVCINPHSHGKTKQARSDSKGHCGSHQQREKKGIGFHACLAAGGRYTACRCRVLLSRRWPYGALMATFFVRSEYEKSMEEPEQQVRIVEPKDCRDPHYEERKDMYLNASDLDGLRHKNADPLRSECAVSSSRLVALVLASVYDICQAVDARVGPEEMSVLSAFEDGEVPTEGDVLHDDGRVLNAWSLIVTQQHHLKNEPCSLSESDSSTKYQVPRHRSPHGVLQVCNHR